MPSFRYHFLSVKYDGQSATLRELPVVPVRLRNPDGGDEQDVYALLDTGADTCVISAGLAASFNHRIRAKGVKSHLTRGIEGRECRTYKHSFEIALLAPSRTRVVWRSDRVLLDCVRAEIPPLLGFDCFLKHFCVTFDYPRKQTVIAW